jgi:hypothetical protein
MGLASWFNFFEKCIMTSKVKTLSWNHDELSTFGEVRQDRQDRQKNEFFT